MSDTERGQNASFETMLVVNGSALDDLSRAQLERLRSGVEFLVGWYVGDTGVSAAIGKRVLGASEQLSEADQRVKLRRLTGLLGDVRLDLGLSQSEVARAIGTQQSAVSEFEQGTVLPRVPTLMRVSGALGVGLELIVFPRSSAEGEKGDVKDGLSFVVSGEGLERMTNERWDVLRVILDSFDLAVEASDGRPAPNFR